MAEAGVLIVGAGPTGLAMAASLANYEIPFDIIDKLPEANSKSKALVVHARTMELFFDMGCSDRFLEEGIQFKSFSAHADGKQIVHFNLSEIDSPFPFALCTPQHQTEKLLTEHLLNKFNKTVRRSCELTALDQTDNDVSVTLKTADGEESHTYKWVVACDGSHSIVRKSFQEPYDASGTEEGFFIADLVADWGDGKQQPDPLCVFSTKQGLTAFFALPGKFSRIIINVDLARAQQEPTLEEIQKEADRVMGEAPRFSDPQWLAGVCVRYRQVQHYRLGRVFFAGDAAHIHSPVGGQGMNTGIQDAYNLAWKLALAYKGKATDKLLDSYHNERHAVGRALLKTTDMITKVNVMRHPIARELRNKLAPILAAQEVIQGRMRSWISETGINYRPSPVVQEHKHSLARTAVKGGHSLEPSIVEWFSFSAGPHAGDRACDAGLRLADGTEINLHEVLRETRHVLLLLSGGEATVNELRSIQQVAEAVQSKFCDLIKTCLVVAEPKWLEHISWQGPLFTDPDYSMHHRYGAGSSCMYLMRPDNYIGMRSQPAEFFRVEDYLKEIVTPSDTG